jgi:hypothetical protein
MAAPQIEYWNSTGTAELTSLAFEVPTPGTPTAAQGVRIYNQKGGVDAETARNLRLVVLARAPGETYYLAAGRSYLDERWPEARIVGSVGDVVAIATAWTPLGAGGVLALPDLPKDAAVRVEVRLNVPMTGMDNGAPVALEILLRTFDQAAIPAGWGLSDAACDGVLAGIGDGSFSGIFVGGDVLEAGTPDNTVECLFFGGADAGIPYGIAPETLTLSNLDGNGAALAGGQSYINLLSVSVDGWTETKGAKGTSPEPPTLPAGEEAVAYVTVPFSAVITDAEIENVWVACRYKLTAAGLIGTLGPGQTLVDNSLQRHTYPQSLSFTASATNRVWQTRAGSPAVTTTATPPAPRALLLYEVDTDGSGVTAIRDRRIMVGPRSMRMVLAFLQEAMAEDDPSTLEMVDGNRDLLIDPEFPGAFALTDPGDTPTSGETRADLQFAAPGEAWASVFPDADSMPAVAWDADDPTASECQPTVCVIPARSRVRAVIDGVVTATSPPGGGAFILSGWVR